MSAARFISLVIPFCICQILLVSPIARADYAREVLKDNPVAWWRLADKITDDGAAAKAETRRHAGVYRGRTSIEGGVPGIGGKAAKFDGRTAYVEVPNHKDFALNSLTVECWFRSKQVWTKPNWPASATLISKGTSGAGSSDWVLLGGSAGGRDGVAMSRTGPNKGPDYSLASPPAMNDGKWRHLVWTRGPGGENRLYIDGALTAGGSDSGGAISNDRPIQIGGDPFLKGKYFDGLIAEVAIYKTVLDKSRIIAHLKAAGRQPGKFTASKPPPTPPSAQETSGGWKKFEGNPVMGGKYGTCFDISVLREGDKYRMWLSWRPKKSVALVESADGVHWSQPPKIVLGPRKETPWEDNINRPGVVKRKGVYHMWYTGQARGRSWIGYATSGDGVAWKRMSDKPVLSPEKPWEKVAVMCPHVLWDSGAKQFRMWYSGGEQNEPNAIGYAVSPDGIVWTKHKANPVFRPDPKSPWEKHKVTGGQIEKRDGWYVMFYIGFRDEEHAQIGMARSRDGITNWQRHRANPIVRAGRGKWDHDACYKPYAIFDGKKWLLWYNGRHGSLEQIGVVFHEGEDLGFSASERDSEQK